MCTSLFIKPNSTSGLTSMPLMGSSVVMPPCIPGNSKDSCSDHSDWQMEEDFLLFSLQSKDNHANNLMLSGFQAHPLTEQKQDVI